MLGEEKTHVRVQQDRCHKEGRNEIGHALVFEGDNENCMAKCE